jgi:putative DNA primase/helicase
MKSDERESLDVTELDLRECTAKAIGAIAKRNDPPSIFQREGDLVRVDVDRDGVPIIKPATFSIIRHAAANALRTTKRRGDKIVDVEPPRSLCENIIAEPHSPFPSLRGIATAPFFTANGRLVLEPGYDPETRLILLRDDALSKISPPSSSSNVAAELDVLLDVFQDFPFAGDADRAHALSLLLLPFVREAIDGLTPLHMIDAPKAGTGKTLLTCVALSPGCGAIALSPFPRDEEEARKAVTTALAGGRAYAAFDNAFGKIASGVLAAAITSGTWRDRLLGGNREVALRNRLIWVATGNNIALSDEIARRCAWVRLDPQSERPEERTQFAHHDLLRYVAEHRARIIQAALTIVGAWFSAGCPAGSETLGSFEVWSRTMGGILANAGVTGFLANRAALAEVADAETRSLRAFVDMWAEAHDETDVTATDLLPLAERAEIDVGRSDTPRARSTTLGKRLVAVRDRIFAGWKIEQRGMHSTRRTQLWGLRAIPSDDRGHRGLRVPFLPNTYDAREIKRIGGNEYSTSSGPRFQSSKNPQDTAAHEDTELVHGAPVEWSSRGMLCLGCHKIALVRVHDQRCRDCINLTGVPV